MIDPRISLAAQAPRVSQALDIFERTKQGIANREAQAAQVDIAKAQEARQAALDPLNQQIMQQQADIGQMNVQQGRDLQILKSVNDFAVQNAAMINRAIETGDNTELQKALVTRRAQLQAQGLPTDETDEAIMMVGQGNTQGFAEQLQGAVNLYGQMSGPKQVSTKAFAPITDPETGQISIPTYNPNTGQTELVPVEGATQETPEQKRSAEVGKTQELEKIKGKESRRTKAIDLAIKKGGEAFDRIEPIQTALSNFDEAIKAIDEGAATGVINSLLPNIRDASIKLDNVKKRLGLDVIGNTTFGALSESELAFALDSALPTGLKGPQLKEWLTAKKTAQQKVLERMQEAATFLSSGENSVSDWVELNKARSFNQQSQGSPQKQDQVPPLLDRDNITKQPLNIGRFQVVEVN